MYSTTQQHEMSNNTDHFFSKEALTDLFEGLIDNLLEIPDVSMYLSSPLSSSSESSSSSSEESSMSFDEFDFDCDFTGYYTSPQTSSSNYSPSISSCESNLSFDDVIISSPQQQQQQPQSKFDQSTFAKEMKSKSKKASSAKKEKAALRKLNKKTKSNDLEDDANYTKLSGSATYLELLAEQHPTGQYVALIDVFTTKRRRTPEMSIENGDLANPTLVKTLEVTCSVKQSVKYVSLKDILCTKKIHPSGNPRTLYTWVKFRGTDKYFFLYCQTGKGDSKVHNIATCSTAGVTTKADSLNGYSAVEPDSFRFL